jgi:hypothetical protein
MNEGLNKFRDFVIKNNIEGEIIVLKESTRT